MNGLNVYAAAAHLRTAAQLAWESEHTEIAAWCLETQAWQMLTAGDYQRAADISQAAQRIAPKTSSAFIQATAQEGRAWARLGTAAQTRGALSRVEALVSPLPMPERPEHHYRYDPPKAQVYVATTLSWLGDTAAEGLSRQVLAAIEAPQARPRPRRAALARLVRCPTVPGQGSNRILLERNGNECRKKRNDTLLNSRSRPPGRWSITPCRSPR